jgi:hypothetical protein
MKICFETIQSESYQNLVETYWSGLNEVWICHNIDTNWSCLIKVLSGPINKFKKFDKLNQCISNGFKIYQNIDEWRSVLKLFNPNIIWSLWKRIDPDWMRSQFAITLIRIEPVRSWFDLDQLIRLKNFITWINPFQIK